MRENNCGTEASYRQPGWLRRSALAKCMSGSKNWCDGKNIAPLLPTANHTTNTRPLLLACAQHKASLGRFLHIQEQFAIGVFTITSFCNIDMMHDPTAGLSFHAWMCESAEASELLKATSPALYPTLRAATLPVHGPARHLSSPGPTH